MENIKLENKSLKSELEKITVKKYNSNKKECDVTNDKENNSKLLLYSSFFKQKGDNAKSEFVARQNEEKPVLKVS